MRDIPIYESFTYDGKSSQDFGIGISGEGTVYGSSDRDVETVEVPGRNGDIVYDKGRYKNKDIGYSAYIAEYLEDRINAFSAYMSMRQDTYYRLTDTYNPDKFRLGRFHGGIDPDIVGAFEGATFTLLFNCKPQKFLTSGETSQEFTASGTITNPTYYEALPLIRVYATEAGSLTIGDVTVGIKAGATEYIDIDSDLHIAYEGTASRTGLIEVTDHQWPVLHAGDNGVEFADGVTKVVITPRWYTL